MAYKRLGDVLIDAGKITLAQLEAGLAAQKQSRLRLGDQLISMGVIAESDLIGALQEQLGVEFVDPTRTASDPALAGVLNQNIAREFGVVVVGVAPDEVYLAMSDPLNFMAVEAVRNATRRRVIPMVATAASITRAIMQMYGNVGAARAIEEMQQAQGAKAAGGRAGVGAAGGAAGRAGVGAAGGAAGRAGEGAATGAGASAGAAGTGGSAGAGAPFATQNQQTAPGLAAAGTQDGADETQSAPTIRLVNSVIERAVTERASDIHLEPRADALHVRMRIDGLLHTVLTVPSELQQSVIARCKVMGGMNTSERRVPQDGRCSVTVDAGAGAGGVDVDLRMNTLPTIYGESVVVRLLEKNNQLTDSAAIGLFGDNLAKFNQLLSAPEGMILVVGPTGSGKSSTMQAMISELKGEGVKLITLEDPVEYNIDGANQVQINEKVGMTFASGLRAILRQDPDVIAVGEIRDAETAQIAMRAAITGHVVLSTVHTSDVAGTIDRLVDLGVEPYMVAAGVRGIVSQRLVRRVCPHCAREVPATEEERAWLQASAAPGAAGEGPATAAPAPAGESAAQGGVVRDAAITNSAGTGYTPAIGDSGVKSASGVPVGGTGEGVATAPAGESAVQGGVARDAALTNGGEADVAVYLGSVSTVGGIGGWTASVASSATVESAGQGSAVLSGSGSISLTDGSQPAAAETAAAHGAATAAASVMVTRGAGCPMCFGTGYKGRTGVFEILLVDKSIRQQIAGGATRENLGATAQAQAHQTMAESCRELVLSGVTTPEEARRVMNMMGD